MRQYTSLILPPSLLPQPHINIQLYRIRSPSHKLFPTILFSSPPKKKKNPFSLSHDNLVPCLSIEPLSPQFHHCSKMSTISTCLTVTPTSRFYSNPRPVPFTCSVFAKPPKIPFSFAPNPVFGGIPKRVWDSRVLVRATVDLGRGIRPGGAVESDKLPTDVRKRTMEAVDGCGGRVTIGDVASRAGLKLNEAQKALQALAADTDGFLEVCFV